MSKFKEFTDKQESLRRNDRAATAAERCFGVALTDRSARYVEDGTFAAVVTEPRKKKFKFEDRFRLCIPFVLYKKIDI